METGIRTLARRAIRTTYWLWSRRLEAPAIQQSRSDYKRTWELLSRREPDAKMFVASQVDAKHLADSAAYKVQILDREVGIRPTDIVLEIGCGVGGVAKLIAPRCAKWIGTDISRHMLEHTGSQLQEFSNVRLVELSGAGLREIESDSVDVVYCTVVFMHLYEWDRFTYIKEAHRVLRPGGRCYFDNIDITSSHGWKVFQDGLSYAVDERPAYLAMTSSADEFRTYGKHTGFTEVNVRQFDDAWVSLTAVK